MNRTTSKRFGSEIKVKQEIVVKHEAEMDADSVVEMLTQTNQDAVCI